MCYALCTFLKVDKRTQLIPRLYLSLLPKFRYLGTRYLTGVECSLCGAIVLNLAIFIYCPDYINICHGRRRARARQLQYDFYSINDLAIRVRAMRSCPPRAARGGRRRRYLNLVTSRYAV
eukprot:SAG31_NODE_956_length_10790_cov_34.583107_12_plen_120_part_00